MMANTQLEKKLTANEFVVTCEWCPPCGIDTGHIKPLASELKEKVDAVAVNDNPCAHVKMSALVFSKIILDLGLEPILTMTLRDRNRLALQSDLLGAAAMGIKNILCMTGDHPSKGDHPEAGKVFDLDSSQWLAAAKSMRDSGTLMSGKAINGKLDLYIGATANPMVNNLELHGLRIKNKAAAGAQFFVTQPVFNIENLKNWLNHPKIAAAIKNTPVIAGVLMIKSAQTAAYLNRHVSGIQIPDDVIHRINQADEKNQAAEGVRICIETTHALRQIDGVKGIHIIAVGCEDKVADIIQGAEL